MTFVSKVRQYYYVIITQKVINIIIKKKSDNIKIELTCIIFINVISFNIDR